MAKPFQGKQTKAEEMAEAKAVRSGRMTPAQYARGEKSEGDEKSTASLKARGEQLASGRLSPEQYAGMRTDMPKKMANGGMVKGYADGGIVQGAAPNAPCYTLGPGVRSRQDYKK